jgi:serine/threonine protein phosphatase PrpC
MKARPVYAWAVNQVLPRFDFRASVAAAEDIGKVRDALEDAHRVAADAGLFLVADGIGGHKGGEIASRIAIEAAEESFRSERTQAILDAYANDPSLEKRRQVMQRMRRAIEKAHEAVQQKSYDSEDLTGMGTTLDVVCLLRNKVFIAHVGDARVYLARSQATLQLTQDHTDFAMMKARGQIRPSVRNVASSRLASAVGPGEVPVPDLLCIEVTKGERLLVCTDGVHGQLESEKDLSDLLRQGDVGVAAKALLHAVSHLGRDNATALVIEIGESFVKRPATDRALAADDLTALRTSALLQDLPEALLLAVLSAAVEQEIAEGETVAQAVANDMAAYVVLSGLLELPGGRRVTTGALLFPESLVGVGVSGLPVVKSAARVLRLRRDDFTEVCKADPALGMELFRRVAEHVARGVARSSDDDRASQPGPGSQTRKG